MFVHSQLALWWPARKSEVFSLLNLIQRGCFQHRLRLSPVCIEMGEAGSDSGARLGGVRCMRGVVVVGNRMLYGRASPSSRQVSGEAEVVASFVHKCFGSAPAASGGWRGCVMPGTRPSVLLAGAFGDLHTVVVAAPLLVLAQH